MAAATHNHSLFGSSFDGAQDYLDGMDYTDFVFTNNDHAFDPAHWSVFQSGLPAQPSPALQMHTAPRPGDALTFGQMEADAGLSKNTIDRQKRSQLAPSELTPPNSAVGGPGNVEWTVLKQEPRMQHGALPTIDTHSHPDSATHLHRHGQITPPVERSPSLASASTRKEPKAAKSKRGAAAAAAAAAAPIKRARATKRSRKAIKLEDDGDVALSVDGNDDDSPGSGEDTASTKRRRFLERNRQAAYTCRQRKKEWSKALEERYRDLDVRNKSLKSDLVSLQQELQYLRGQLVDHSSCECTGVRDYLSRQAKDLLTDAASGSDTREATARPATPSKQKSEATNGNDALVDGIDANGEDLSLQLREASERLSEDHLEFDGESSMEAQLRAELARFDEESAEGLGLCMDPVAVAEEYLLLGDGSEL